MSLMSYTVTVAVTDGTAVVTTTGTVPDGEFQVHGHEDESQRTLGVVRRGPDGRYAAAANSVHYKET